MGFKDGFSLIKDYFSFLVANRMSFLANYLFILGFLFVVYMIQQNIALPGSQFGDSMFLTMFTTILIMMLPFFVFNNISISRLKEDRSYIKSSFLVPFKLRAYLFPIIFSVAFIIPIFVSIKVIPDNFFMNIQEVYGEVAQLESNFEKYSDEERELLGSEIQLKLDSLEVPTANLVMAFVLFFVSSFLIIGSVIFIYPLAFIDSDEGMFQNIKDSGKTFFKNIRALSVFLVFIFILYISFNFIVPVDYLNKFFMVLSYSLLFYAVWFVAERLFIDHEIIDER